MKRYCAWTLMLMALCLAGSAAATTEPIRVGLVFAGSESESAWLGARQGLDEANLQGRFLGQVYELERAAPGTEEPAMTGDRMAIIAALDPAALRELAARWPGHAILNVSSEDDGLRAACIPNLLHVIPSARMRADAVAQWRQKHPESEVEAFAWHPQFMKFAGRDLNKRFRAAFDRDMDSTAWAGWAAVKMISDMIARRAPDSPAALLALLRTELAFDGQKGIDLSFRPNGQLRQPLLLVDHGELAGEAPVRGVAASDADLDSLGQVACAD